MRHAAVFVMALVWSSAFAADIPAASPGLLRQLRFSPDGRYVLARDDSEIAILTVQPFTVLFRIPAANATDAEFTTDSRQVIFVSSVSRVNSRGIQYVKSAARLEHWGIAGRTRVNYRDLPAMACGSDALSPDGRYLACNDFAGTLSLVDVDRATTIFEKREFVKLIPVYKVLSGGVIVKSRRFLGDLGSASLDFSPDGRFLLAIQYQGAGKEVVCDFRAKGTVKLTRAARPPALGWHLFLSPHRLLISEYDTKHAAVTARIVEFPSGKVLSRPSLPPGGLFRTTDPNFVLIRPVRRRGEFDPQGRRATALDLSTGDVIISQSPLFDVLGDFYVAEPFPGEVWLYKRGKGLQAKVALYKQ